MRLKSELVPAQLFCFWVWSTQQKSRFSEHHALWHVWSWGSETCLLHMLWLGKWSWGGSQHPPPGHGVQQQVLSNPQLLGVRD